MIELAGALGELGVSVITDQHGVAHPARHTDLPAILLGESTTLTTAPIEIRLDVNDDIVMWHTESAEAAERLKTIA